jgi:hypothetical protein
MTLHAARKLAADLEIGLDAPICLACLSFVSMAIDGGNPREVAGQVRSMAPILWDEGLSEAALAAARQAEQKGRAAGAAALADLEQHGGRSAVARAIVERLAHELSREAHEHERLLRAVSSARRGGPPELN